MSQNKDRHKNLHGAALEQTSREEQEDKRLEKIVTIYLIVLIALVWLVPYTWIDKLSIWMNHREIERRLPPELRERLGPFGLKEIETKWFQETPEEGREKDQQRIEAPSDDSR